MDTCQQCHRDTSCLHKNLITPFELNLLIALIVIISQFGYALFSNQLESNDVFKIAIIGSVSVSIILIFLLLMYFIFDKQYLALFFGCHQIKERSLHKQGIPFILCARCTGILIGMFLSIIVFLLKMNIIIMFIFMLPLVVEGIVQRTTKYKSRNSIRLLTGIVFAPGFLILYGYINFYIHTFFTWLAFQLIQLF